ncbi:transcriptional regulator, TetR family [hydrothermal vent metagenome]|uniref:Transcriptional regulator, TetR family n=1 Tax=hydrothermal vent metagenome TaxID=652676 RepID=A0A1W1CEA3_9ZZZZ
MAIVVDKDEKRRNIALSCKELLLERGIGELTIAQLAKRAGVGKGTIYEYFENKEDIVFEIITIFMSEYEVKLLDTIESSTSSRDKIYHFFALIFEDDRYIKQMSIYQEFLAISLVSGTDKMVEFSISCKSKFATILDGIINDGISRGELSPKLLEFIPSLLIFEKGLIVDSKASSVDSLAEIDRFVDMLFLIDKEN